MNRVVDDLIVALVLAVSAGYALMALGPKGLRKRIWGSLASWAERVPAGLHLQGVALRFRAAAERKAAACGGCDNCDSTGTAPKAAAGEVRIPLAKIGRRNPGPLP
jgi:hypothetical protein